ncbi:hypothetical protein BJ875DRAFT_519120 [Amylocarpus encephaloides]|uniref:Cell wall protein n=1 Tax=Amylocarpus encephaloides TaxID=45428 RepID=A0A9P7YCW0_9HELO|nr:hypothetical protein BJ875DRAFT_519120 [Amylocarpus encephaloides]
MLFLSTLTPAVFALSFSPGILAAPAAKHNHLRDRSPDPPNDVFTLPIDTPGGEMEDVVMDPSSPSGDTVLVEPSILPMPYRKNVSMPANITNRTRNITARDLPLSVPLPVPKLPAPALPAPGLPAQNLPLPPLPAPGAPFPHLPIPAPPSSPLPVPTPPFPSLPAPDLSSIPATPALLFSALTDLIAQLASLIQQIIGGLTKLSEVENPTDVLKIATETKEAATAAVGVQDKIKKLKAGTAPAKRGPPPLEGLTSALPIGGALPAGGVPADVLPFEGDPVDAFEGIIEGLTGIINNPESGTVPVDAQGLLNITGASPLCL